MKNKEKLRREFLEELETKHNCGVARNLYNLNKNNLDKPAIFYRGATISYKQMFAKAFEYADALTQMGIEKGMQIPMCLSHCPEELYIILAASFIGAEIRVFGEEFDKDYIEEEIKRTNSKVLFVTDDKYEVLEEITSKLDLDNIVMFSLHDSYPVYGNPYKALEKGFYSGEYNVDEYISRDPRIIKEHTFSSKAKFNFKEASRSKDFAAIADEFSKTIEKQTTLDDVFSVTYSSGSTNAHRPKAIKHRVRSWNAMGMAHNGYDTPKMKNLRVHVQIPSHSNTGLISSIADTLSQGCCCALEYIYDEYFFPTSLLINKSNEVIAPKSHWIRCFKEYETNPKYESVKRLPFLFVPIAAGEATSPGEEKYFNKMLRKYKAGTDFIPSFISVITMSMAGGDCEHGGIFFNIFKALKEKIPGRKSKKEPRGYDTYRMVEVAVLDKDGNHCGPNEHGLLVANSPCTMVEYDNNAEATEKFFVRDAHGKVWGSCNTHGFIDLDGGIHIKGRIPDSEEDYPPYLIQDQISKDTKNILSCEVVQLENGFYVAHIERMPGTKSTIMDLLCGIEARLKIPTEVSDKLVYKIRDFEQGYPLTNCGKRSTILLREEQLSDTLKVTVNSNGESALILGESWYMTQKDGKKHTMDRQKLN